MSRSAPKTRVQSPARPLDIPEKRIQSLSDLSPDTSNANKGTVRGRQMLETSVRRYGYGRSVVADKHGRIIAGNKTVEAAQAAGAASVIVVPTTGKDLVVVQRTDLDLDRDTDAKELAIADNRSGEVGLEWNVAVLQKLDDDGVDAHQFWRPPEWAKLLSGSDAVNGSAEIPEMALQPFEHHDYVMVVFTNSQDWGRACELLGIKREKATLEAGGEKVGIGRVIAAGRLLALLDPKK